KSGRCLLFRLPPLRHLSSPNEGTMTPFRTAWRLPALVCGFLLISGAASAQLMWVTKAPLMDPRTGGSGVEGAAASLIGTKLYVSHGYRFGDSDLLSVYDIPSDTWTHGGPSYPDA